MKENKSMTLADIAKLTGSAKSTVANWAAVAAGLKSGLRDSQTKRKPKTKSVLSQCWTVPSNTTEGGACYTVPANIDNLRPANVAEHPEVPEEVADSIRQKLTQATGAATGAAQFALGEVLAILRVGGRHQIASLLEDKATEQAPTQTRNIFDIVREDRPPLIRWTEDKADGVDITLAHYNSVIKQNAKKTQNVMHLAFLLFDALEGLDSLREEALLMHKAAELRTRKLLQDRNVEEGKPVPLYSLTQAASLLNMTRKAFRPCPAEC